MSIGELVPGAEAKLMREDGTEETRVGERGEFWIRTPNGMKGYWKNRKATEETLTGDGWLRTGDIAYRDEQDRWYMVDRIKVSCSSHSSTIVRHGHSHTEGADKSAWCTSCSSRARSTAP